MTLWNLIVAGDAAPAPMPALVHAARRFAALVSPALAQHFLAAAEARLGGALIAPASAAASRLANRFNRARQRQTLGLLQAAGIEVVCLKGFALAHLYYPDADLRCIGDLDLLVREGALGAAIETLEANGFAFGAVGMKRWGFISDASFVPMIAADGTCAVDLHIQPDCYPAYRSLTAEALFAEARTVAVDGLTFRAPRDAHNLTLCITNAAKDKFGAMSLRRTLDALTMLRATGKLDWEAVDRLARHGHFRRPARVFCRLLEALGVGIGPLPPGLAAPLQGLAGRAFERLKADALAIYPNPPGQLGVLSRELTLCTDPDIGLYNMWLRLRGLVHPARGLPACRAG